MTRILPSALTSYDLLKTASVLLMIADHIGAFFFPDILWLRVLGRLCVPVWFFLAGHARSRGESWPLLAGGAALTFGAMASGQTVFPLNILFTILAVRALCAPLARVALFHFLSFWPVVLLVAALIPGTYALADYGALGLLFALYGYMAREGNVHWLTMIVYALFCAAVYAASQFGIFPFTVPQLAAVAAGSFLILAMLARFRPVLYATEGVCAAVFKFTGRHTLALYVFHLLAIEAAAMTLYPEKFRFMQWGWSYFPLPFTGG